MVREWDARPGAGVLHPDDALHGWAGLVNVAALLAVKSDAVARLQDRVARLERAVAGMAAWEARRLPEGNGTWTVTPVPPVPVAPPRTRCPAPTAAGRPRA